MSHVCLNKHRDHTRSNYYPWSPSQRHCRRSAPRFKRGAPWAASCQITAAEAVLLAALVYRRSVGQAKMSPVPKVSKTAPLQTRRTTTHVDWRTLGEGRDRHNWTASYLIKGNSYILTVIDHFSKWVELMPMRNQEASTVAKLLVDRVFCVHSCPIQILTDQGPNFESSLFQELCKLTGVDKIRTTAYKPSTNGNIERFHSTMHNMLAKLVSTNQSNWDQMLPTVAFAYRTSVQESTHFTPYYLMYGREARIPADLIYGPPPAEDLPPELPKYVEQQQASFHQAYELTRQHLGLAAKRRKRDYDLRVRPQTFPVGSWVWCLIPRCRQGRYQKWQSMYQGPFQVTRILGPVTYEIQRNARCKPCVVHVDKIKPCHSDSLDTGEQPASEQSDGSTTARPKWIIRRPARFLC